MSEQEELYGVFAQEAREQLGELESGLLRLEQGDTDSEAINAIFRAAHTLKGASGVVELRHIERFTHVLENLLDKLRTGELAISGDLMTALLAGCDHLRALIARVEAGDLSPDEVLEAAGASLGARLRAFGERSSQTLAADPAVAAPGDVCRAGDGMVINDCWHLSLRFGRDVLRQGMDPLAFLRYLTSLGDIVHMTTMIDALPLPDDMDPESCYLGFEIDFRSNADKVAVERVFDFVRDECKLEILPPNSRISDFIRLIESLPEESLRLGEILVSSGALTADELQRGLASQAALVACPGNGAPTIGEILVDQRAVQPEIVEAAAARQKAVAERKAGEARLIRVQADKLDQLIDLVGELVIAGASANLFAQRSAQPGLVEATSIVSRLVESIRDAALQLRMVQIGETFNRFQRVVRDVSRELDKEIDLVVSGGETELDKSVVEKIADPLMHLVRNAIDHGIEAAALRLARGKPARGRVTLEASHDSGSIVIVVADDGGGLNRERILQKAEVRGIVQPGQVLSDAEICNLIFEPGFSTADQVTNLSGRGVGMDVVRKNILALRGSVEVQSASGEGSRFVIRLPLTLAIIDGFLVGVGKASYVVPLDAVVECLELPSNACDRNFLNLRGEVLPFVRLRELFEMPGTPASRENVVVVRSHAGKTGIVVDVLHGELQTVIKPLASLFRNLRGIGGSTILGTGEVALILNVDAISHIAARGEQQHFLPASSHA